MLDINLLRKDLDSVVARLLTRKSPQVFLNVDAFKALEAERKTIQMRTEELQSQRNTLSKQIGHASHPCTANKVHDHNGANGDCGSRQLYRARNLSIVACIAKFSGGGFFCGF